MIIDKLISPAINVALSSLAVSTQTVGDVIDFQGIRDQGLLATPYGPGFAGFARAATSGGAATLALSLVTDDNAALSSPTAIWTSATFTLGQVAGAGQKFWVPLPDILTYERYLALRVTVGTAVFTGGLLDFEFAANKRRWKGYPSVKNT